MGEVLRDTTKVLAIIAGVVLGAILADLVAEAWPPAAWIGGAVAFGLAFTILYRENGW